MYEDDRYAKYQRKCLRHIVAVSGSQLDAARIINRDQSHISYILKGKKKLSAADCARLAMMFNFDIHKMAPEYSKAITDWINNRK